MRDLETTPLNSTFSYFGAKRGLARLYKAPKYPTIIEPFGGGLGYSHFYHVGRDVLFTEKDPVVRSIWEFVLANRDTPERFLELPDWTPDMDWGSLPEGARNLIGFCLGKTQTSPLRYPSVWEQWNHKHRLMLSRQAAQMKRWTLLGSDYREIPNIEATYFVDPPYQLIKGKYSCGPEQLDFEELAEWVVTRKGEVYVCETEVNGKRPNYLPFEHFTDIISTSKKLKVELLYYQDRPRDESFVPSAARQQTRVEYYQANYAGRDLPVKKVAEELARATGANKVDVEMQVIKDMITLVNAGRCLEVVPLSVYRLREPRVLVTPAR